MNILMFLKNTYNKQGKDMNNDIKNHRIMIQKNINSMIGIK